MNNKLVAINITSKLFLDPWTFYNDITVDNIFAEIDDYVDRVLLNNNCTENDIVILLGKSLYSIYQVKIRTIKLNNILENSDELLYNRVPIIKGDDIVFDISGDNIIGFKTSNR